MLLITTALVLATATTATQPIIQDSTSTGGATDASGEMAALPSAADADDPALAKMGVFIESLKLDKTQPRWKTGLAMPPKLTFTKGVAYSWNLQTNKGVITVELMPDVAPMHVSSTIFLARNGFYDGITFHRVITGFMAQGGCPLGTGTGNPGYKYDGEFDAAVKHDQAGMLSMANAGPGTDGSQFFLTFTPTPHLDGKHTIFGKVVGGMDVVKLLEKAGSARGQTTEPLMIVKSTISIAKKADAAAATMK
ncbi:MAG: peptidyl-prolyl cis-trans isomerase B (cyclophilin B) [Chlamydiales bacterium]|jgi:peptidyl-prolyl cis-trans isomerase B (cyclophilin B)